MEDQIPELPFIRGELLDKMSRITYYIQTRALIALMSEQIEDRTNELDMFSNQTHNSEFRRKTRRLDAMKKQKERLMTELTELECHIQKDIEDSKKE